MLISLPSSTPLSHRTCTQQRWYFLMKHCSTPKMQHKEKKFYIQTQAVLWWKSPISLLAFICIACTDGWIMMTDDWYKNENDDSDNESCITQSHTLIMQMCSVRMQTNIRTKRKLETRGGGEMGIKQCGKSTTNKSNQGKSCKQNNIINMKNKKEKKKWKKKLANVSYKMKYLRKCCT